MKDNTFVIVRIGVGNGHTSYSYWDGKYWAADINWAKQYTYGEAFLIIWEVLPEPLNGERYTTAPYQEVVDFHNEQK